MSYTPPPAVRQAIALLKAGDPAEAVALLRAEAPGEVCAINLIGIGMPDLAQAVLEESDPTRFPPWSLQQDGAAHG